MRAGSLNTRITIQRPAAGQDSFGQPNVGWDDVALVWASVKHPSGLSTIAGGADVSIAKASVRIRYRVGLDAGMRVLAGGAVYEIDAVLPDLAKREHIDLVCRRIA